ncbi:MAG TPA: hypothetical protein VIM19_15360, partial [Actinomycetes bacterium]
RRGHTEAAVGAYLAHGRVHTRADDAQARARLVDAYLHHRRAGADPYQVVALTSSRHDATALNDQIRQALATTGLIATHETVVRTDDAERRFATGDLVVITHNDHRRGLLNGTRATIERTDRTTLRLHTETGQHAEVPVRWASDHLDHGYALTVHKAQGLTTDLALIYGTAALSQQAGYVALSRGRTANHLFTSAQPLARTDPTDELDIPRFQILTHAEPADALDLLQERLSWSRRHTLAQQQQPARQVEERGLSL